MTANGATRTNPMADVEAAHQRYADLEAQAAEVPEGERAHELDHAADAAYAEYLAAWHSLESTAEPQPEAEAEPEVEIRQPHPNHAQESFLPRASRHSSETRS